MLPAEVLEEMPLPSDPKVMFLFFLLMSGDIFLHRLVEILPRFSSKRQAVPMLAIAKIICDRLRPLAAFGHFLEG